ncbi:MAG: hypothetical protein FJX80_13735 [Bacteroidetes bacterium]|nr:hypothetical protein [Bacteroidota bacterium]
MRFTGLCLLIIGILFFYEMRIEAELIKTLAEKEKTIFFNSKELLSSFEKAKHITSILKNTLFLLAGISLIIHGTTIEKK